MVYEATRFWKSHVSCRGLNILETVPHRSARGGRPVRRVEELLNLRRSSAWKACNGAPATHCLLDNLVNPNELSPVEIDGVPQPECLLHRRV